MERKKKILKLPVQFRNVADPDPFILVEIRIRQRPYKKPVKSQRKITYYKNLISFTLNHGTLIKMVTQFPLRTYVASFLHSHKFSDNF